MSSLYPSMEQILADKYKPIVYLHPRENYYPCTIEWYLNKCSLWQNKNCIKSINTITTENIPNGSYTTNMDLHVEKEAREGYSPSQVNNVPFYTHVSKNSDGDWQITYIFLYAYNGPFWLCGIPERCKQCDCCQVGAHEADIEHVTVIIGHNLELKRMYYAAHGTHDGLWLEPRDIPFENDQPVVYSAKHSHASYPFTGTICRCLGFISDHAEKGLRWDPNVSIITDETEWNNFQGYLGINNEVPTPKYHEWWEEDNETSTNWWKRVFCVCY